MNVPFHEPPHISGDRTIRWNVAAPLGLVLFSFALGVFFMRPDLGEPDSYREALSAYRYLDEGIYSSYWDHPLTMYLFVFGTLFARAFDTSHIGALNTIAVILGAAGMWPFYHLVRRLVNRETALVSALALMLSPAFIRFSTYLSHEVAGFAFALWSLYLFERMVTDREKLTALAFGISFGATWSARPNAAMFIALPLLTLLSYRRDKHEWLVLGKLVMVSLLGFVGCLAAMYRPALIRHLASFSDRFLFTYYDFGRYLDSTTRVALESLTPVLAAAAVLGFAALVAFRKYRVALFGGTWVLVVYLFYTGMYSVHRYFLIAAPPCVLLLFAAADQVDRRIVRLRGIFANAVKGISLVLLVTATLGPSLGELLYLRQADDDKVVAESIGEIVGGNLLLTTSLEPMVHYYTYPSSPETVYVVTEHSPGAVAMNLDALAEARNRLEGNLPVFVTNEIPRHFERAGVEAELERVWEYKSLELFRIRNLRFTYRQDVNYGLGQ